MSAIVPFCLFRVLLILLRFWVFGVVFFVFIWLLVCFGLGFFLGGGGVAQLGFSVIDHI